jgi:hypothetical protein
VEENILASRPERKYRVARDSIALGYSALPRFAVAIVIRLERVVADEDRAHRKPITFRVDESALVSCRFVDATAPPHEHKVSARPPSWVRETIRLKEKEAPRRMAAGALRRSSPIGERGHSCSRDHSQEKGAEQRHAAKKIKGHCRLRTYAVRTSTIRIAEGRPEKPHQFRP